jgi:putative nucleotidyltransferase with HDIG domain
VNGATKRSSFKQLKQFKQEAWHLVRRFGKALRPGGPGVADLGWVAGVLSPAELRLWGRTSGPDRRHSVAVARRVEGNSSAPPGMQAKALLAAALLHDVGKLESGLGTFARVGATLVGLALGRSRLAGWADRRGVLSRVGRYLAHDRIGAELLVSVGSDELVVTWAREHHLPPECWTVPPEVGALLKAADNSLTGG